MMMSVPHKAVNPFEDWLFVDYATWQKEVQSEVSAREITLLNRLEAVFPHGIRQQERQWSTWLIYQSLDAQDYSDMNWNGVGTDALDEEQIASVFTVFEALYKLCLRDRERLFVMSIALDVLMSFGNIPNLESWWEKLDPYTDNIDGFILSDITFHQCLAETLTLYAQYALIDQNLDTAHRMHRHLKKAGYSYKGKHRIPYLEQWSHVSLMLTEVYTHKKNSRNARLLYEDIGFVDEELAKGNPQVLEDHAKGAELLIWLSREQVSKPKTLQLQRDLYSLVEQNITSSAMLRHFINGAISMAQSYGNEGQLQAALRLWDLAYHFVTRGQHQDHPEVLMLLGKLGMNVIWTHTGKEAIEPVQSIYDQLCAMAANAKGHPIQFFEQCAWAGVNLAWVYAQRGQLEGLPQLLNDIHTFEAHYPVVFGFKEAAAAACRNGLWGMRQTKLLHQDLVFQCIEHEVRRLIMDTFNHPQTQVTSTYFLQQLSTTLYQLGQLDIRLHDYNRFAERLPWAETLASFSQKMQAEQALFLCEYALLGIEHRQKTELLDHIEAFWNILNTLATQFAACEDIQRLYALGVCHWMSHLKKTKSTKAIEALLVQVKSTRKRFQNNMELLRAEAGLHATLSTSYAEADQWSQAQAQMLPFEKLLEESGQDTKVLQIWADVLTKLVTQWPHHRNVQATLPYLETLLDLSKKFPKQHPWPTMLAQVRAHHCQSFFMIKQADMGEKELQVLGDLWKAYKPHHVIETAYMNAQAAKIMWSASQATLQQAQQELWDLWQHHDEQQRERRPLIAWKATLTSALSVFHLALKQQHHAVADTIFRRTLNLVKLLPTRQSSDSWRSLGYMALGWMNHTEKENDPRVWFKKVLQQSLHEVVETLLEAPQTQGIAVWDALRKPKTPYLGKNESAQDPSHFMVGFLLEHSLTKETLNALYQDPDPLWIQQKCFEVCVLEGSQQAEDFYQQVKGLRK
ncbi:MAG: hypothetical protein HEQ32_07000 [Vampirovibrio sp.]